VAVTTESASDATNGGKRGAVVTKYPILTSTSLTGCQAIGSFVPIFFMLKIRWLCFWCRVVCEKRAGWRAISRRGKLNLRVLGRLDPASRASG
jgi:hypothetical protein